MVIYKITNSVNGKQYIGQTSLTLEERVNFYYFHHAYPSDSCYPIERAMRKHGFDNFVFKTLRECATQRELDLWERHYIKKLGTKIPVGYNVQDGGRFYREPSREAIRGRLIVKRYLLIQRKKAQLERKKERKEKADALIGVRDTSRKRF